MLEAVEILSKWYTFITKTNLREMCMFEFKLENS